MMWDKEKKLEIFDFIAVMLFIVIGCAAGKYYMENVADTWLGFNGPAIGIIVFGEMLWRQIRRWLIKIF